MTSSEALWPLLAGSCVDDFEQLIDLIKRPATVRRRPAATVDRMDCRTFLPESLWYIMSGPW